MSYIRSTSNPEGLYIWGDGKTVTITKGPKTIGYIPTNIFHGLIKKYNQNFYPDECSYKGASIKEVHIGKNFKVQLSYDNWKVNMWDVTWHYIVSVNYKKPGRSLTQNEIY